MRDLLYQKRGLGEVRVWDLVCLIYLSRLKLFYNETAKLGDVQNSKGGGFSVVLWIRTTTEEEIIHEGADKLIMNGISEDACNYN